jgi:xanthine dehydrogenase accessory factor
MDSATDILDIVSARKASGAPFALATVVRTVAATAAKAGAKAVISSDGAISEGWIGGGCARAAVLKAAREALADGKPRLISVQPLDALQDHGVAPGVEREGVRFAANMCPSQGTMDIFIEPVLPHPQVVVIGASPVATAVAALARRVGFKTLVCAPKAEHPQFPEADQWIDGFDVSDGNRMRRFIIVSTQGRGDEAALRAAMSVQSDYVAFVGSRKKAETLKAKLAASGAVAAAALARLKAPAGLDIGAITPDEIALSILAEIVEARRRPDALETGLKDAEPRFEGPTP